MTNDAIVYIDEETGEVVEPDRSTVTLATLGTYATAKLALDVTRLRKRDYLAMLEETDPELAFLVAAEHAREKEVAAVEDALSDVFSDELRLQHMRAISLDIGAVRVTWGKPPERWTQRVKPQALAERDPELAKQLGIECKVGDPPAPRITIRADKAEGVAA